MGRGDRPRSFARAAMLLLAAAAALPLSLGVFFIEGSTGLAIWVVPFGYALYAGLCELNGWRRSTSSP